MRSEKDLLETLEELKEKRDFWQKEMNDSYDKWKLEGGDYPRSQESRFDIYEGMIRGLNYALGRSEFI